MRRERGLLPALLAAALLFSGCKPKPAAPPPAAAPEAAAASAPTVQEPVVAGRFYPADPTQLRRDLRGYLDRAMAPELSGRPVGFMVPHAGVVYSGPVAGYAYKAIAAHPVKRYVIMGPSHRVGFDGVFVLDKDSYRTPLGVVRIDREGVAKLKAGRPFIGSDERLYGSEHSVEVQLPFLQEAGGPDFSVVVLVLGRMSAEKARELARALNQTFPGDDTVFIASSDMSHGNYPPFKSSEQIRPVDLNTLKLIEAGNLEALELGINNDSTPLCGGLPVITLLNLYRLRGGGGEIRTLRYGDSGDSTGDHSQVVGYGAVALMLPRTVPAPTAAPAAAPTPSPASGGGFTLSEDEKKELLKMARAFAEAAVKGGPVPELSPSTDHLRAPGAAFVTLKRRGELAGCIGSIIATEPLFQCVQRRAIDAAIHDARFFGDPIRPEELGEVEVEISVLTPPERVSSPDEIKVGRDGVLLTLGDYRGVFLPQVPGEQGWSHDEYLSHLCGKAGVPDPNCWRRPEAVLERFQAIVFSEKEMGLPGGR